jgi:hypothetical protein
MLTVTACGASSVASGSGSPVAVATVRAGAAALAATARVPAKQVNLAKRAIGQCRARDMDRMSDKHLTDATLWPLKNMTVPPLPHR